MDWHGWSSRLAATGGALACALWGGDALAQAGCGDGSVEVVFSETMVGCAGAWNVPGLIGTSGAVAPSCGHQNGNTGVAQTTGEMSALGLECTAGNLCAPGWSLCGDEDFLGVSDALCEPAADNVTRAIYLAAVGSCRSEDMAAVGGCGNLACDNPATSGPCAALNRVSRQGAGSTDRCDQLNSLTCSDGGAVVSDGWTCLEGDATQDPAKTVTKRESGSGGVMCCFREPCDCVDDEGNCYVEGEETPECRVCIAGEVPGAPLTHDPACVDMGVPEADMGSPADDAGAVEPADGGNGGEVDASSEGSPEISFRGDGGCECRSAGDGTPPLALSLLALAAFVRRRRRTTPVRIAA